jgi:death-on-curing protein
MHAELIKEHGGAMGVRFGGDELIESALARPQHRFMYEDASLVQLAAAYLYGLAKNHGYIDGNKRVAFAAAVSFLDMNGVILKADEKEAELRVIGLIEGQYTEQDLAEWIRLHSAPGDPA